MNHRSYVGPEAEYDLISAMTFNLLTSCGLREYHKVLDIGCGSLRNGRLLIPYLNRYNYIGVEPNQWLVKDGINYEVGGSMIKLRKPKFIYNSRLNRHKPMSVDYCVAQSIFSHCSKEMITNWLKDLKRHLKSDGKIFATFIEGQEQDVKGWVYPNGVRYRYSTIKALAEDGGFSISRIKWFHPRQVWIAMWKNELKNTENFTNNVHWNNLSKK